VSSLRSKTVAWLGALASANLLLFVLVYHYSVGTIRGQMLDTAALAGNSYGRDRFAQPLNSVLNAITVASLVIVVVTVGVIALARRRYSLAIMAMVMVAGSTATTKFLKDYLTRPEFGVDPQRSGAGNSLPSGHATAAAAFAVGLVLVLPPAIRGAASVIGATYAALVGVATLSSGWHRPSDVIASYLLVGGWAAVAGLMLVVAQRRTAVFARSDKHPVPTAAMLASGLALEVAGIATLAYVFHRMITPVDGMSSRLQLLGYVGSVMVIAGSAYLMMAVVVRSIHRVVPHHKGDGELAEESARVRLLAG
jgi:membrane-associated phospholipid phosphatase